MVSNTRLAPSTSPARNRRGVLQTMALAGAALTLAGCGFTLRRSPRLAFDALRVQGGSETGVTRELRNALETSGVQVFTSAGSAGHAAERRCWMC